MKKKIINLLCIIVLLFVYATISFSEEWMPSIYGWWYKYDDGTFPANGWQLLDGNKDGIAEYYYFDERGFLLQDTICPDYSIVNKDGQKLDRFGNVITEKIEEEEINMGSITKEVIRHDLKNQSIGPQEVFVPATNSRLVMKNVVLKEDKTETASRKLVEHIVGGDKYKLNQTATVTGKTKWKEAILLNGTGAYIIFDNPGFSRIRGKVTHAYKSTTDDTHCCIYVIVDDEDYMAIEDFDFKNKEDFEIDLPEECMKIKFLLEIIGDYTTRKVYIKDLTYRK